MSKFFQKYDDIGAIAGAKAFKADIENLEAKAEDAWKNGFNKGDASEENGNRIAKVILSLKPLQIWLRIGELRYSTTLIIALQTQSQSL